MGYVCARMIWTSFVPLLCTPSQNKHLGPKQTGLHYLQLRHMVKEGGGGKGQGGVPVSLALESLPLLIPVARISRER